MYISILLILLSPRKENETREKILKGNEHRLIVERERQREKDRKSERKREGERGRA